jgi:transcriptional regulator with XRE-family HTH domain
MLISDFSTFERKTVQNLVKNMDSKGIVAQLQEVRKAKGYSYQDIVDMTAAIGKPLSMSTVRRVFSGSTTDFRYETTIQPLAQVLLAESQTEDAAAYQVELEALRSIVELKNEEIEKQKQAIASRDKELAYTRTVLRHKNRVEWMLTVSLLCLVCIMVIFYVAHSVHGW